jgi:hypothetical protein
MGVAMTGQVVILYQREVSPTGERFDGEVVGVSTCVTSSWRSVDALRER